MLRDSRSLRSRPVLGLVFAGLLALGSSLGFTQDFALPRGYVEELLLELDPGLALELGTGGLAYTAEGEVAVYSGGELRLHGDEGVRVLACFEPAVFGDFLRLAPDGRSLWFGESSEGFIYRVALEGEEAPEPLAELPWNFDLAFGPTGAGEGIAGEAFVSALGETQSIYRVRAGGEVDPVVSELPGFSGPLVFDAEGSLYYVTQTTDRAPSLLRFRSELLAEGLGEGTVPFGAAEVLAGDVPSLYNLCFVDGRLFGTNLGFARGSGAIEVLDPADDFSVATFSTVLHESGIASPSYFSCFGGGAGFAPGQGPSGGRLLVAYSDFSTLSRVVEIRPELWFLRGEVNNDGLVDLSDALGILGYLFLGEDEPSPREAADVTADGSIDLSDAVRLLGFLFLGEAPPPAPFPERGPALD